MEPSDTQPDIANLAARALAGSPRDPIDRPDPAERGKDLAAEEAMTAMKAGDAKGFRRALESFMRLR